MDKLKERLHHTTSNITNRFSSADSTFREEAAPALIKETEKTALALTKETEVAPPALTKEEDELETPPDKKALNILRIGSEAPNFSRVRATTDEKFDFHEYIKGSWAILFSHPCDFTSVCTTELADFARNYDEFKRRGVKLIGLSVGTVKDHSTWIKHIHKLLQIRFPESPNLRVKFPIIADNEKGDIARMYNMIDQEISNINTKDTDCSNDNHTIRSVFFIDNTERNIIRAILSYPTSVGRSLPEIIRIVDALRTVDQHGVITPCNWKAGRDTLVPEDPVATRRERKHPDAKPKYGLPYMLFEQLPINSVPGYEEYEEATWRAQDPLVPQDTGKSTRRLSFDYSVLGAEY